MNTYKDQFYEPGFITVLHTFGRDLKWNPHCHVLLCEKLYGTIAPVDRFLLPYPLLRRAFERCLLKRLSKRFGKIFSKLSNLIYKAYPKGFYVHAPSQIVNTQAVIKYIGRYLGRPPIASSRIDSYDGHLVTFHYTRHEDDKTLSETIPALEFIKRLIVHIPDKHFKMIRYYGFYSSEGAHNSINSNYDIRPKVSPEQRKAMKKAATWRAALIYFFSVDPLKCSVCGATMEPLFFTFKAKTYYFPNHDTQRITDIHFRFVMKTSLISSA